MALPQVLAINLTASPIILTRLGLSVPANSSLLLSDFAYIDEVKSDETLYAAVSAGSIVFDLGNGTLNSGDSLKLYNVISHEMRMPVKAMSDANIASLSGPITVDGVSLLPEDRILLNGQTLPSDNGIWVIKAAAWVRPSDFGIGQSAIGATIYIDQGSVYADNTWQCTSNYGSDIIGSSNLSFSTMASAVSDLQSAYVGGNIITSNVTSGNVEVAGTEQFVVSAANGISVTGPALFTGSSVSMATSSGNISLSSAGITTLSSSNGIVTASSVSMNGLSLNVNSDTVNISDPNLYLNKNYTTAVAKSGGVTVNYLPTSIADVVATGGFVAGVAATSNPTVTTSGTATFLPGDLIQVSGSSLSKNDGLYEVLSHVGTLLSIRGVGLTPVVESFTQSQFVNDSVALGAITKVNVSSLRTNSAGGWEVGTGSASGITFSSLAITGSITLQDAYISNNTLTTDVTNGSVVFAGTEGVIISSANGLSVTSSLNVLGTSFSLSATSASSLTTTGADLSIGTASTGSVLVDGISGVSINSSSGAINLGSSNSDGALNIGTGSITGRPITIGNNVGTSSVVINSGSNGVVVDGITYYGKSLGAPPPSGSGFVDGDKYYDTGLAMEMRYDATRGVWLSVESSTFMVGRNKRTAPGQYYRGLDGRVLSASIGFPASFKGVVVGFSYTREDFDAATFEITASGVAVASLASSATSGNSQVLNGAFNVSDVLAVRNSSASNKTDEVQAWVRVRWTV